MGRASCIRPLVEAVRHSESVSEVKVASRQRLESEVVGDVEMRDTHLELTPASLLCSQVRNGAPTTRYVHFMQYKQYKGALSRFLISNQYVHKYCSIVCLSSTY